MVRITGKGGVLDAGGDQKSPPLPFIEVDETTARALIGTGAAVLVGDVLDDVEEPVEPVVDAPVESVVEPEPVVAEPVAEPVAESTVEPAAEPAPAAVVDGADERRQTIADALDLLEPEHFVKTGARAGRPKLNAVEEITGIRDLTVAEIDAVFAAKAAE